MAIADSSPSTSSGIDIETLQALYAKHQVRLLVNEAIEVLIGGQSVLIEGVDDFTAGRPKSVDWDQALER
ncbi:MAG: hypothetical protein EBZ84_11420, partial [Betaproteobacteria bacterium]|nr:hypothetical protein [Betaproteobacteria bacterium]